MTFNLTLPILTTTTSPPANPKYPKKCDPPRFAEYPSTFIDCMKHYLTKAIVAHKKRAEEQNDAKSNPTKGCQNCRYC
ncbi:hypothetical protein LOAG_01746 [Loa loa]|uniref:Uncharacterized protein n=1 Tax=Loa loa TaxID=7209 RepID=A0A1S0U894_LOALO|nr:hypothetical protein LOAG_01746 [Loa loa]EFO26746.1 hypothetical protein LOAG_01746 [Loa loa]